eukprot:TRINITY_DN12794_c0_g1_i2.p1 TRINITY_DN12794_c0_g1~~TRINITY_DN12794_c0_g1_i2.p1  ORF type:complete len:397 (+),score=68.81 TRINITY_DN12794_c0_g1_i2:698-1888(+)
MSTPTWSLKTVAAVKEKKETRKREVIIRSDGSAGIATPWLSEGVVDNEFAIGKEVVALKDLILYSPSEVRAMNQMKLVLQKAVSQVVIGCDVYNTQSFLNGLALQMPDEDEPTPAFVVTDFPKNCDITRLTTLLAQQGITSSQHPKNKTYFTLNQCQYLTLSMKTDNGGNINISIKIDHGEAHKALSDAQQLDSVLNDYLKKYPSARDVFVAVWLVLSQSRCNIQETGGISPYATMIMVLYCCTITANASEPSQVLVDFFAFYGAGLMGTVSLSTGNDDEASIEEAISGSSSEEGSDVENGNLFRVIDPVTRKNIVPNLIRGRQISSVFKHCSDTIAKWSGSYYNGYRGRTPLSSILAYDKLWDRVDHHKSPVPISLPAQSAFSAGWTPLGHSALF